MGILSGIRVLDLATYIAAPAAATIMSDFGADVIKVERPPYGDPYRYLSVVPGMPISEEHYCWLLDGRNKRSLALDLCAAGAREVIERLVKWADVVILNFQPQQLRRFRLTYDELALLNPRLIYAQVTGYGEDGDEADKPGFDATAYWARSGLMASMHNAGADPVQSPAGFGDHPTSSALFGAIMLGLYQRERTGNGSKVSTSLMANGAWSNSCQIQAALVGAEWPVRRTRAHPSNPLINHYVTRDGQRFMFCLLDPQRDWPRVCRVFGWDLLIDDARFSTVESRRLNAAELVALIDAEVCTRDMSELAELFRQNDVIWGPVPLTESVGADRQMEANGVFDEIEGTSWRTVMSPIMVHGEQKQRPRLAPSVGQHSAEVLQLLGFNEEETRQLMDGGVIRAATSA